MKNRLSLFLFLWLAAMGIFFFSPRSSIINTLKIDTGLSEKPDLISVLGGGITQSGELGHSTRERLDAVVDFLKKRGGKCPVLVQEYPAGRKKMVAYLVEKGIDERSIISSGFHYREKRGGTENNIAELIHVLNEQGRINQIVLVTSPYHQRRVSLMLKASDKDLKDKNVHFYFLQLPDNGEIAQCSRWRFWHLVSHEVLGIFFQQLKH